MKTIKILLVLCSAAVLCAADAGGGHGQAQHAEKPAQGADALQRLIDGNKRYAEAHTDHPNQMPARRLEVTNGQHPFAIILTCADSRVAPEILFDQGLGDLFVLRVAGNVADDEVIGSIEYAAEHLGVPLLVVMGHERCGAVDAAVKGGEVPGHIGSLVKAINPAVIRARGKSGDLLENCVRSNVEMVAARLKSSKPILSHLVEEGRLEIVGAYYDLDDGIVQFMQ